MTITTQTTVSADWLPLKCQPIVKAGEAFGHRRVIFIYQGLDETRYKVVTIYLFIYWLIGQTASSDFFTKSTSARKSTDLGEDEIHGME